MDRLLYGHNTEERIVAVHQLDEQSVRVFKRVEGKILQQDMEFFPFFFLVDESLLQDFPKKFWFKQLSGGNYYRFIAAFSRWNEMWEAIHHILRQHNKNHSPRVSTYQDLKGIFLRNDPVRQFLLQSGITLFKGMEFDELVRLQIDVQCTHSEKKPVGKHTKEQILVISINANTGEEYSFLSDKIDEREILNQCIQVIRQIDPDVIEGYDLFGSILPAIARGCERSQLPLTIGRNGEEMHFPSSHGIIGFGEGEWFGYDVFGRHLVDIHTLAESDIGIKKIDRATNLIGLAKYFQIPFDEQFFKSISKGQEHGKKYLRNVKEFSRQNARIVNEISTFLSPTLFYLTQICPFTYRMNAQLGASSHIESLLLREYLHQKHSIPKPSEESRNISIPSEMYQFGIFSDVLYIKLEELYSSILLLNNIKPQTDYLNVFLQLLDELLSYRKVLIEQTTSDSISSRFLDARVQALQYLMDSFHLYLGSSKGLFSDPDQAERVLYSSREILKEIIRRIEIFNGTIIQSDGNGFYLLVPDNIIGEINQKNFITRLSEALPNNTTLQLAYRYKKMLSYRRGNYAVLDIHDKIHIKGNAIISRTMEQFLKTFALRFIECLMTHDLKRLHHTFASAYTQVVQHKWQPSDFCKTEFARVDSEIYQRQKSEKRQVISPAMEAAIRSSLFIKENSKVSYYFTGSEPEMDPTLSSRIIEDWDPNLPDENTAYYLARLYETANKFKDFFEPSAFDRILSLDQIFGFSDEGIRILTRKSTPDLGETKFEGEDLGIWLDGLE
jgi:DNA polymerase elongation subunit (family B)